MSKKLQEIAGKVQECLNIDNSLHRIIEIFQTDYPLGEVKSPKEQNGLTEQENDGLLFLTMLLNGNLLREDYYLDQKESISDFIKSPFFSNYLKQILRKMNGSKNGLPTVSKDHAIYQTKELDSFTCDEFITIRQVLEYQMPKEINDLFLGCFNAKYFMMAILLHLQSSGALSYFSFYFKDGGTGYTVMNYIEFILFFRNGEREIDYKGLLNYYTQLSIVNKDAADAFAEEIMGMTEIDTERVRNVINLLKQNNFDIQKIRADEEETIQEIMKEPRLRNLNSIPTEPTHKTKEIQEKFMKGLPVGVQEKICGIKHPARHMSYPNQPLPQ